MNQRKKNHHNFFNPLQKRVTQHLFIKFSTNHLPKRLTFVVLILQA
jgi:hypothetical protein